MNPMNPIPPDRPHRDLSLLLPWYANGTLQEEERVSVHAHLSQCPACRRELARLRALRKRIVRSPHPDLTPQAGYARLLAARQRREPSEPAALRSGRSAGMRRWLRQCPAQGGHPLTGPALAAALLLPILPLGWHAWHRLTEPRFHTLADMGSTVASNPGDLRLVVEPGIGSERIDALLRAIGGSRVGGPGSADVLTVRLTGAGDKPAKIEAALAYLRRQAGVLLAEPAADPAP